MRIVASPYSNIDVKLQLLCHKKDRTLEKVNLPVVYIPHVKDLVFKVHNDPGLQAGLEDLGKFLKPLEKIVWYEHANLVNNPNVNSETLQKDLPQTNSIYVKNLFNNFFTQEYSRVKPEKPFTKPIIFKLPELNFDETKERDYRDSPKHIEIGDFLFMIMSFTRVHLADDGTAQPLTAPPLALDFIYNGFTPVEDKTGEQEILSNLNILNNEFIKQHLTPENITNPLSEWKSSYTWNQPLYIKDLNTVNQDTEHFLKQYVNVYKDFDNTNWQFNYPYKTWTEYHNNVNVHGQNGGAIYVNLPKEPDKIKNQLDKAYWFKYYALHKSIIQTYENINNLEKVYDLSDYGVNSFNYYNRFNVLYNYKRSFYAAAGRDPGFLLFLTQYSFYEPPHAQVDFNDNLNEIQFDTDRFNDFTVKMKVKKAFRDERYRLWTELINQPKELNTFDEMKKKIQKYYKTNWYFKYSQTVNLQDVIGILYKTPANNGYIITDKNEISKIFATVDPKANPVHYITEKDDQTGGISEQSGGLYDETNYDYHTEIDNEYRYIRKNMNPVIIHNMCMIRRELCKYESWEIPGFDAVTASFIKEQTALAAEECNRNNRLFLGYNTYVYDHHVANQIGCAPDTVWTHAIILIRMIIMMFSSASYTMK